MPRRKNARPKTRRAPRRVRVARRRTVRRPRRSLPRTVFAKDMYTTLRYNETGSLASTTGSIATQLYKLNSLFDPNTTGTGHQPRFFDTLCGADGGSAPYGKYRVLGARIKVTFMNSNSAVTSVGYTGIRIRTDDAAAIGLDSYVAELPNTSYRLVNVSTGVTNFYRMARSVSIKKFLGLKDLKDDDSTAAEYNASPTNAVYAELFYYPRDTGSSATVLFDVMIEFIVQFFDLNTVTSS